MTFVPVSPPEEAPANPDAEALGLIRGLRAEMHEASFSCSQCHKYQLTGPMVWVPDTVSMGDSVESVTEQARRFAYNGSWSGWCLTCARWLSNPLLAAVTRPRNLVIVAPMMALFFLVGMALLFG